jgi:hypothetical protein
LNNEKRTQIIKQISTLENEMHDDEQQGEREAAHPPAKKRIVLVEQPPSKCMNTCLFKPA